MSVPEDRFIQSSVEQSMSIFESNAPTYHLKIKKQKAEHLMIESVAPLYCC